MRNPVSHVKRDRLSDGGKAAQFDDDALFGCPASELGFSRAKFLDP